MWACARAAAASSKRTVSSVQKVFRAVSGTNLIKKGEIVTGRLCGRKLSGQCLHGMRKVLVRVMCFFLPCDIAMAIIH